ncbi:mitochondrial DNA helicase [Niveomyces insectorum RCEF 264]|uniref:ATP-dependent DNA helicase PIF1 n=1 Tax=Niveomyces insectorum RCEF 264 TaxID=1081102 RepID=A0A167TDW9_9HYPO|nr:mitochondrial DNA helicase [Niveomyces insectorum RCEF 264]
MTTGVLNYLPPRLAAGIATPRRLVFVGAAVGAAARVGFVTFVTFGTRPPATGLALPHRTMLGRANKTYEARTFMTASAAKPPAKPSLEKTLFPSSSPRDGSVAEFCKRPLAGTATATATAKLSKPWRPSPNVPDGRPTGVTKPLQPRSPNLPHTAGTNPRNGVHGVNADSSGFVTLCGKPGSFADEPFLVADSSLAGASGIRQADESDLIAYGVSLDDFTDDENLDLDFQSPRALPGNPPSSKPAADTSSTSFKPPANNHPSLPPAASSTPACSWSSSPPSHFLPPSVQPNSNSNNNSSSRVPSAKRGISDGGTSVVAAQTPVAKKRTMPRHWSKPAAVVESYNVDVPPRPADRPKGAAALWDVTASTVKAQKKQLKDQFRKPTAIGGSGFANEVDGGGGGGSGVGSGVGSDLLRDALSLQKPTRPTVSTLSGEQQQVKNLVCIKNASVFFTGPAGTGKSVLMRAIIRELQKKYAKDPEKLGVTASTGLAACNIGGMTLHSFAGIGLGKEDAQTLIKKIRRNPKAKARWLKTKTLVIDEISMVDGDLFDKLSQIGRTIRNNGRPWGGIQLVLTGDFFQLPPVPDREKRDVKFAFEAATWNTSIDHTIGLTEVFRQKDPEFAQMLNEMRLGRISEQTVQIFKSLARPLQFNDGLEVTELFPTRTEVESSNERRLRALPGKSYRYEALDTGEPNLRDKLLQNMMAPKTLELRVGAQVMLIKNMDETLVNGSLGTVAKFMTESEYELAGGDAADMFTDPDAKKRTKILTSYLSGGGAASDARAYPFVQFHAVDGSQRGILVRQEDWKVELPTGEVQASRQQIPLILAWALSIHKAQGQTLERVKVDLGRVFEKGQAYVALSRATTKTGLQVLRFEKHKVMAHPRVVEFYAKLYSAESALKSKGGDASILAFARRTTEFELEPAVSFGQRAARMAGGSG